MNTYMKILTEQVLNDLNSGLEYFDVIEKYKISSKIIAKMRKLEKGEIEDL